MTRNFHPCAYPLARPGRSRLPAALGVGVAEVAARLGDELVRVAEIPTNRLSTEHAFSFGNAHAL